MITCRFILNSKVIILTTLIGMIYSSTQLATQELPHLPFLDFLPIQICTLMLLRKHVSIEFKYRNNDLVTMDLLADMNLFGDYFYDKML